MTILRSEWVIEQYLNSTEIEWTIWCDPKSYEHYGIVYNVELHRFGSYFSDELSDFLYAEHNSFWYLEPEFSLPRNWELTEEIL